MSPSMPKPSSCITPTIKAARSCNQKTSIFAGLPTELLLLIERYASGDVIMVLRGTCHRFFHLYPDPTTNPANSSDVERWRQNYTFQRRRFQLKELVQQEKDGSLPKDELVCWLCERTHLSPGFSAAARKAQPEGRRCIGWEAKLRLCSHKSVTFNDVCGRAWKPAAWCGKLHSGHKSYLDECMSPHGILGRSPFEVHYCRHTKCWRSDCQVCGDGGGRGVRMGVVGRGVDSEGRPGNWSRSGVITLSNDKPSLEAREIVVRAETVIMQLEQHEKVDCIRPQFQILKTLGLCPHLSTDDLLRLLESHPYVDCPHLESHGMETSPCPRPPTTSSFVKTLFGGRKAESEHCCGRKYHCPNPECSSYFYFYRTRYTSFRAGWKDELVFCVVRSLGSCRVALDKNWLIQTSDQDKVAPVLLMENVQ